MDEELNSNGPNDEELEAMVEAMETVRGFRVREGSMELGVGHRCSEKVN